MFLKFSCRGPCVKTTYGLSRAGYNFPFLSAYHVLYIPFKYIKKYIYIYPKIWRKISRSNLQMFKYEFALERARLLSGLVSLHLSLLSLCLRLLCFGCHQRCCTWVWWVCAWVCCALTATSAVALEFAEFVLEFAELWLQPACCTWVCCVAQWCMIIHACPPSRQL